MNRPVRAAIYGFAIWWVWLTFVGVGQVLPESITSTPSYALARLLVLVLLVVGFAVDYLRRVGRTDASEGLVVGLLWMALMIANDFGHFIFMESSFDVGRYLTASAPLYAFIPVITVTLFSQLMVRTRPDG